MNRTPSKIRARDGPIMLDWFKLYQHAVSLRDGETISFSSYCWQQKKPPTSSDK